ncbi:MAG: VOC family protein [bacterium]
MATVSTYLNFAGHTEEAFEFYRSVFGGEFTGIQRFSEVPQPPGAPPISPTLANMVINIALPILGGHILMGTDAPAEMGFTVTHGNATHIMLHPDTREEADRIFEALSVGGAVEHAMQEMFWGAYFGNFTDKFGTCWMINVAN